LLTRLRVMPISLRITSFYQMALSFCTSRQLRMEERPSGPARS
jgi:hypothetical protein